MKLLLTVLLTLAASPSFAQSECVGGFNDCFKEAYAALPRLDAVQACTAAGAGFKNCFAEAYAALPRLDAVKLCRNARVDFKACYAEAYAALPRLNAIKTCLGLPN